MVHLEDEPLHDERVLVRRVGAMILEVGERRRDVAEGFVERYETILSMLNGPTLVMTIYTPSFKRDPAMAHLQRSCELVVGMFNDIIQQLVRKHRKDLLELRDIFIDERDYANETEEYAV